MAEQGEVSTKKMMDVGGGKQFQTRIASIRKSLKARDNAKSGFAERMADKMTLGFGSMPFLLINCAWFLIWMVINLGFIPGVPAFDPFPFGLLTMIVSLEAIILAIIVLISQNRAARLADLREEVALQVEEISEQEVTKILSLMVPLLQKQGISLSHDAELQAMLKPTDTELLTEELEKEI
jgi:uncharacterized membrane protein